MVPNESLTVALETKDGQAIELETKRGSQGHIIELTEVVTGGELKKSFHSATPKPIPSNGIFDTFKRVVNKYIQEGSIIIDSTMPFRFENDLDQTNWPLRTGLTEGNEFTLTEQFNSDSYAVQVIPAYGTEALVSFDINAQYAISVMSPAGIPICVNQRNMVTLCKINQYLNGKKLLVDVQLGLDGSVYIKDLYYFECDRTGQNLIERIQVLNQLFNKELSNIYVVNPLLSIDAKQLALRACEVTGREALLVHAGTVLAANQSTREKYKMDLKNETTLQVMNVCKASNTVTLCAHVDGIPIELGWAYHTQELEIEELDAVRVKFSSAETGELKNIEIITKLDSNESTSLDPVLARKLGFNLHPRSLKESELYDSDAFGFLDKLEQCQD